LPKSLPAPTLDYLLNLRSEQERVYADDNAQIDRLRGVRTLSRPVMIDERYRINDVEVRDPTLADEIQRVVATLALNAPTLTVTPARIGDTAEANATLREKWTEAVLERAGTHPTGHTRRDLVDACVGDGGAWTKLVFKSDLWEARYGMDSGIDDALDSEGRASKAKSYDDMTEEAKKVAGPPFVWQSIDVRTINPQWSGTRLASVLEVQVRPIHAALRDFSLTVKSTRKGLELIPDVLGLPMNKQDSRKMPATVEFLEFWDREWCSYVVLLPGGVAGADARVVKQFRHGYGRVPYFYAPGYTFNWQRNRKVGWGIGESKRWLVEYLSYLETIHAQVAARDAFPPLIRKMPELSTANYGDNNAPSLPEYWEIRQIYNLRPGEELTPMAFPGVGIALKEQIQMVKEQIQSLQSPKMAGTGSGSGLEGAGFAINQVLAESRVTQDPICQHIEQMMQEITHFLWQLVRDKVQETVWVRAAGKKGTTWMGAGPDELDDSVLIEWHLDPERPSAKLIEERYWHERIEKGTAGRHMAITEMGSNPDEVDDDRELDRIRQTDWYQKRHDLLLMQALERGDILLEAAQKAVTSGQLPGVQPGNPQAATQPQMQPPGFPPAPQPGAASMGMGTAAVPDMGRLALQPSPGRPGGPSPMPGPGGMPPAASAAPGMQ
jgi:hypothetical protein